MPTTIYDIADFPIVRDMIEEHCENSIDGVAIAESDIEPEYTLICDVIGDLEVPEHMLEGIDMDCPLENKACHSIVYKVFDEFCKHNIVEPDNLDDMIRDAKEKRDQRQKNKEILVRKIAQREALIARLMREKEELETLKNQYE